MLEAATDIQTSCGSSSTSRTRPCSSSSISGTQHNGNDRQHNGNDRQQFSTEGGGGTFTLHASPRNSARFLHGSTAGSDRKFFCYIPAAGLEYKFVKL